MNKMNWKLVSLLMALTGTPVAHASILLDLNGDLQTSANYSIDFAATQASTNVFFAGATGPGFIDVTNLSVVDTTTGSINLFSSPSVVSVSPWVITPASTGSDYYYITNGIAFGATGGIPDVLSQFISTNAGDTYNITFTAVGNTGLTNYGPMGVGSSSDIQVGTDFGVATTSVPEPGSLALMGIAGLGLLRFRRKNV